MEGSLSDSELFGVIPRSAEALFEMLIGNEKYTDFQVQSSYLEIYNEELSDLLQPNCQNKLDILKDAKRGVTCRGLTHVPVRSSEDVLQLMQDAVQTRHVGETRMNKSSSRSHCIFTITVACTERLPDGGEMKYQGKLHLVDLAGSGK